MPELPAMPSGDETFAIDPRLLGERGPAASPPKDESADVPASLGPYRLVRELGRGGQGVVYVAEDTRLGREVALKVLSANLVGDPVTRMRFEREAGAAARLDHPGICTIYEAGTIDGTAYIAMRLIAGETLSARLRARHEADRQVVSSSRETATTLRRRALFADVETVEKVTRALHVAHEAGLVHRDIKPANIMVEASGQPVILDFGLARESHGAEDSLTGTGTFVGTPIYMSPEQAADSKTIDRRTDIWSLGVVLYELTTGRRPFEGATLESLLRAIRSAEPIDPRQLNPAITPELAAVIMMALEKSPDRRYADGEALADDLGRARRLEPVRARPATALTRFVRWAQRNPAIAACLALAFLSLGVGLTFALRGKFEADSALVRESAALRDVEAGKRRAEDLLTFMIVDLKPKLETAGRLDLLADVGAKADAYFADVPPDEGDLAQILQRSLVDRAIGDVRRDGGDLAGAMSRYDAALASQERIVAAAPTDLAARRERASTINAKTAIHMLRSEGAEAIAAAEESLRQRQALAVEAPSPENDVMVAAGHTMLGNARRQGGLVKESIASYDEAIDGWKRIVEKDPSPRQRRELAVAMQNLAESWRLSKDLKAALSARREGLAIFEQLGAEEPRHREWQEHIATTRHGMAMLERALGENLKARASATAASGILRRLAEDDPTSAKRWYQAGMALYLLAHVEEDLGELVAARKTAHDMIDVRRRAAAAEVKGDRPRIDLALAHRVGGRIDAALGDQTKAVAGYEEAVTIVRDIAAKAAGDKQALDRLTDYESVLARAIACRGDLVAADAAYGRTIDAYRELARVASDDNGIMDDFAKILREGADISLLAGRGDEARARAEESATIRASLAEKSAPEERHIAAAREAISWNAKGAIEVELAQEDAALESFARAIAAAERAFAVKAKDLGCRIQIVQARLSCADALVRLGRIDDAAGAVDAARPEFASFSATAKAWITAPTPMLIDEAIAAARAIEAGGSPKTAAEWLEAARAARRANDPAAAVAAYATCVDEHAKSVAEDRRFAIAFEAAICAAALDAKTSASGTDAIVAAGMQFLVAAVAALDEDIESRLDKAESATKAEDRDELRCEAGRRMMRRTSLRDIDARLETLRRSSRFREVFQP